MNKLLIPFLSLSIASIANAEIAVVNYSEVPESKTRSISFKGQLVNSGCWSKAEQKYGTPAQLLVAIAKVETNFKPHTISKPNKNGTYDIGLMQINSGWLPLLSKYNITQTDLLDPCTNIMVGAWILSSNIKKLGYNWNAVGAYNAKSLTKRDIYAKKVHKAIIELGYNH